MKTDPNSNLMTAPAFDLHGLFESQELPAACALTHVTSQQTCSQTQTGTHTHSQRCSTEAKDDDEAL